MAYKTVHCGLKFYTTPTKILWPPPFSTADLFYHNDFYWDADLSAYASETYSSFSRGLASLLLGQTQNLEVDLEICYGISYVFLKFMCYHLRLRLLQNVTVLGERVFKEVTEVKWDCNRGAYEKGGWGHTHMQRSRPHEARGRSRPSPKRNTPTHPLMFRPCSLRSCEKRNSSGPVTQCLLFVMATEWSDISFPLTLYIQSLRKFYQCPLQNMSVSN